MGSARRRTVLLTLLGLATTGLAVVPAGPAAAAPSSVTLTVSDTTPAPHESITLTATANESVTGSGLTIQIWDTARNAYVAQCSSGTTCPKTVSLPSTIRQHTYRAYLAPSRTPSQGAPTSFTAASTPVPVEWERAWRSISPATAPAARYGAHMAYHVGEGVAVLFGGCKKQTARTLFVRLDDGTEKTQNASICLPADQLDDTWVFNAATETWAQVTPSGGPPHKRYLGSMTYDYTSGRVVLFGGLYQSNNGSAPTTDTENCLQQGATSYGVPGVQSVQENDENGVAVEFVCFEDTWTLRKVSGTWKWEKLAPVGNPGARFDGSMAFDGNGRPTLVGGCEGQGYLGSHTEPTEPTEWDCSDYPEVEKDIVGPGCSPFDVTVDPDHPEDTKPPKNDYLTTDPLGETCILREIEHTDSWRLGWTGDPSSGGTPVWTQIGCFEHEIDSSKLCAPPEVRGASLALDPVTRKLVLYGGYYYEPRIYYRGFLGDTWEFDGDTWTKVVTAGAQDQWCPSRAANKAWMTASPAFLGTWQVLNVGGEGAYYTGGISCDTTTGDAQQDPWGGNARPTYNQTFADSWRWDGAKRSANQCPTSGTNKMCWYPVDDGAPTRRSSAAMAYDHVRGKAVLFGGICAKDTTCPSGSLLLGLGDTWVFDAQTSADPCGSACGTAYVPPGGGQWEKATELPVPGTRWGPSVAEDPVRGETVLFGGCTSNGVVCTSASNETWVWDGATWTRKLTTVQPPARYGARLAWDDMNDVLVLFGGATGGGAFLSDTWEWNGSAWAQRFPATSPSARVWHGMDTDATGRPLLFGGCTNTSCSPVSNQTWRWNGTTWTTPCGTATCATSPPAQVVVDQMATDQSGKLLLLNPTQTWSWNGSAWSNVTPPTSPPPRSNGAMAKVDLDGTWGVLLFGGANGTQFRDDTWVFVYNAAGTGGTWSQVTCDCASPPARQVAAMAYSPADGRTVLFGGQKPGFAGGMGDTWSF